MRLRHHLTALILGLAPLAAVAQSTEGVVVPAESWDVAAPVDGKIAQITFSEGMIVTKGGLLMSLESRFKKIEVEIAQASVARAQSELIQRREVLQRQSELIEREAVSVAAFSEAKHDVDLAESDLRLAELQLQMAQETLAAHDIHAAISGVISAPRLNKGSYFDVAESGSVATVHQLDPINVRITLRPEAVLMRLQKGEFTLQDVEKLAFALSLKNGIDYPLTGTVVAVGFELDPETGEGSALISFPNPKGVLRPGLPVVLSVKTKAD
ncbi:efflux RND transporter periplasmic adaptor subunit [Shimia sediminis]|uniref:efflux RND transporter periplasmic adaptor subunit n=1 Tax=Shimia sediminis TaxID=2497945 RepID=UPI0013E00846|nr:efflux RND transporter periplasmic adaptor subunit [Shimia sediminis]